MDEKPITEEMIAKVTNMVSLNLLGLLWSEMILTLFFNLKEFIILQVGYPSKGYPGKDFFEF